MHTVPLAMLATLFGCTSDPLPRPDHTGADDTSVDTDPPLASVVDLGGFTPRNVVVVHVDTLRADSLPQWGSKRNTLPTVSQRTGWIVVEHTVVTAPWTAPSTASLLTSVHQFDHGVRIPQDDGQDHTLAAPTHVAFLKAQAVATALFTGSSVVTNPRWDISRDFDVVQVNDTEPGNALATIAGALDWVDSLGPNERFLAFFQPMDMHGPYRPEPRDRWVWADPDDVPFSLTVPGMIQEDQFRAAYEAASEEERVRMLVAVRAVYDEQMLGVDRALAALMDGLEARGRLDDTLLVLTSDHGESFYDGEPLHIGHGSVLRHEVVKVPLLFWAPDLVDTRVRCLASNMDIFPTIVDAMGLPPMEGTAGSSLLDACRDHTFSASYLYEDGAEALQLAGVESLDAQVVFKCLDGSETAFDLRSDPGARTPLDVADVPGASELAAALHNHLGEVHGKIPDVGCSAAW